MITKVHHCRSRKLEKIDFIEKTGKVTEDEPPDQPPGNVDLTTADIL